MSVVFLLLGAGVFLSTLSLRRATRFSVFDLLNLSFLSTLSLRRATIHFDNYNLHCVISIHALLTESDGSPPPCARPTRDFYPRSPYGERRNGCLQTRQLYAISIHALLTESDAHSRQSQKQHHPFLSTLSLRRATSD